MSSRGITLVEMMVSLALGGTVIAGALTGLAQAQRSWHEASVQGRLHERAQYVFATLEPELQMAGFFGPGALPAAAPASLWPTGARACGVNILWPLQPGVAAWEGAWPFACAPRGGVRPGTDMLLVRRAAASVGSASPGAMQLVSHPLRPELAAIVAPGVAPGLVPGEQRRELLLRIYYVALAADGDPHTPALRVKSLSAIAGAPAFIDTEVMPGVENLQVELLPSPAAPRSVRIHLRIVADAADQPRGLPRAALDITRGFALRNAPEG